MKPWKLMSSEKNILHTFTVTLPYSRMQTFFFYFSTTWFVANRILPFFPHSKFLSVYLLTWKGKNGMKHKTTCRVVRNGRGGSKTQKLETKEIKFVWIIPKKEKNNSSVNSSKIDRKGERKIFPFFKIKWKEIFIAQLFRATLQFEDWERTVFQRNTKLLDTIHTRAGNICNGRNSY